jgi:hypothetical protein
MSRVSGNVLRSGDLVDKAFATLINPDIPSEQYEIPPVLPNVSRKMMTNNNDPPPSDPYKLPPLFFNQIGNSVEDLFSAPIENFNMKIVPTPTAQTPISRDTITSAQATSRYSNLKLS